MDSKIHITRYTKEVAARYLVRILIDAGGSVAFSRFYDGTFHTAELLRDGLRIGNADARWLVPEVVLRATIDDLHSHGDLEILPDTRKKLFNGQRDFSVSLTTQGKQNSAAGKLPRFENSLLETCDRYPVKSKAPRRKTGAEPTREIRASDIAKSLAKVVKLHADEFVERSRQSRRRYQALKAEAQAIHRLRTEQPDKLDPVRVAHAWKATEALEAEDNRRLSEGSRIISMVAMIRRLLKIKSTINGSLAERLLDGADQGDWKYVRAIQQNLVDHGPAAQLKIVLKLEQDDWCGAFLALARKKRAAKRSRAS